MKLLLAVLSGCALFTSSFLSAEPSGNRCTSQHCQCSENCKCGDNCQCGISCACK